MYLLDLVFGKFIQCLFSVVKCIFNLLSSIFTLHSFGL